MRVLVCGDRNWNNQERMFNVLDVVHRHRAISCIIEGEARGADKMAAEWALRRSVQWEPYPADWGRLGKIAGPVRNTEMLAKGLPDLVYAFHDNLEQSKGTKNMIMQSRRSGLTVYLVTSSDITILEPQR